MKRIIALLLTLFLVFGMINTAASNEEPATPSDLTPTIQKVDYTVTLANLSQYNIVALRNANLNGHTRGSIWIGGTLKGGEWKFVDDGSVGGNSPSDSYVADNQSSIQFKGRTSEQGLYSYYGLTDSAISSTRSYWSSLISNIEEDDSHWIYIAPDANGHVDLQYWDYQCPGSDESQSSIERIYWTDATSVTMGGLAGNLIAPNADVTVVNCNHCGSIVCKNITTSGESHINYWNPTNPPKPTPTPTPTPKPITVTKQLKGEIWQVRCDVMDNTTFKAGGGYWKADITNSSNNTSKEGHRSNHCGNKENWVLFVDENGTAISLYQLKSGSTGGTLPSIMYRAPADLASIPEHQLIYDPTDPNDAMTARLINEVFTPSNVMPFSEINLQEGQRLFWISQNGKQVWHHTGVLRKTNPKFAIVVNGTVYNLGVGDSITLTDIEEGLLEVEEIATANYKLHAIEYDEEGNVVVINEIDPPNKPTPTPPPPIVTNTPSPTPTGNTPTPTPTPPPEEDETPTPTPTPTPSPTPISYCDITIEKVVDQYEGMEDTIFYFKITGTGLFEPIYVEISVNAETGKGSETITGLKAGKYTVEEVDIPEEYKLISDGSVTQYYKDDGGKVVFKNQLITPTPSPTPSPTPIPTSTLSPTPTVSPTPSPTPTNSPTPTPSPTSTPATGSFVIQKHMEGYDGDLTFEIWYNNTLFDTITLNINSDTHYGYKEIADVPIGEYTIKEINIPEGYTADPTEVTVKVTVDSYARDVGYGEKLIAEFTNIKNPEPTETPEPIPNIIIGAKKEWNDENNSAGRPTEIHVTLYANDVPLHTYILNEENHWTQLVEVPQLDEEYNIIKYTWTEAEILGYQQEKVYVENDITIFVNKPWENKGIPKGKTPKHAGKITTELEDYDTPLGVYEVVNHAGDCFD